jgi:hypothetical protein
LLGDDPQPVLLRLHPTSLPASRVGGRVAPPGADGRRRHTGRV